MFRNPMIRFILVISVTMLMGACGIKGDLVRPSDVDEYNRNIEENRGSLPL